MEKLSNDKFLLGESPIWNHYKNELNWVDIDGYKLCSFNDHKVLTYNFTKKPTSIGLLDNTKLFVTVADGYGIFDFRNKSFNQLYKHDIIGTRLNDGKCDRKGKYWVSSKDLLNKRDIGSLFVQTNGQLEPILDNIGIGNGLAFSQNNDKMYFSDSLCGMILLYDYKNHTPTKPKVIYRSYNESITPDGGTIDSYDNYYSASWGDGMINIFNSKKSNIKIKPCFATCPAFGGMNYDRLFVTSAIDNKTGKGGEVYWMKTKNSHGVPESSVVISY